MDLNTLKDSSRKGILRGNSKKDALSWLVIIIVLTPFLIYGVPQIVGASDALVVRSGSMEPAIPTGSVIAIYPAEPSELEEGDIITFEHGFTRDDGTEYTTHRIIEVTQQNGERRFKTKGDANDSPDPGTVSGDEIAGVHGFTIPYLGYIIAELDSPWAFIALVAIPAALIILNELWVIMKEFSGSKGAHRDGKMVGMAMMLISFVIFTMSIAAFTGAFSELLQQTGEDITFGSIEFGATMMGSILASMIALKFL